MTDLLKKAQIINTNKLTDLLKKAQIINTNKLTDLLKKAKNMIFKTNGKNTNNCD